MTVTLSLGNLRESTIIALAVILTAVFRMIKLCGHHLLIVISLYITIVVLDLEMRFPKSDLL